MRASDIRWAIDFDEIYDLFDNMDEKQAAGKLGISTGEYKVLSKENRDRLIYGRYRECRSDLEKLVGLPDEVELPPEIDNDEDATEWLSSEYGYLIEGYALDKNKEEGHESA